MGLSVLKWMLDGSSGCEFRRGCGSAPAGSLDQTFKIYDVSNNYINATPKHILVTNGY